ncbi:Multi-sensor Signal Transduction Histidine Kinase [Sulfitobacter noctilucicola]|nr:Multi-sensor Signal Transduction Histidine Kinase [Sulfitobacter noctilucicola]
MLCLGLTGSWYHASVDNNTKVADREFQRLSDAGVQVLRARLSTYLQSINGIAAYVASADKVTEDNFETYVETLQVREKLPSIGGLALVVGISDEELYPFVRKMRMEGRPNFTIKRRSDSDQHYILKYVEPKVTNQSAIGLDLSFTTDRAESLERAKATGQPQMTPPVQLVTADKRVLGFVLFTPIFVHDDVGDPGEFKGWVSAGFVSHNLIDGLTAGHGSSFTVRVYDGPSAEDGELIYDVGDNTEEAGQYAATYQIDQFGRTWTLAYSSTASFDERFHTYQPLAVLIAGLALTAFLVMVLRSFRRQSASLAEIAKLRAKQITAREEENKSIIENDVTSVLLLDDSDRVRFANLAAQNCFGYTDAEMRGMRFSYLASQLPVPTETHNAIGNSKDGRRLELDLQRNDWIDSEGTASTTVILRDLTKQNNAQRDLTRNKALYDMALQGAEIGVFDINLTTGKSEVSETWCRIMGFDDNCGGLDTQKLFMSRIHPDDVAVLAKADLDCIEGRTERSIAEYRLKNREGGWSWMRSDAVIVERDTDGTALRMIGTQTDVTGLRHDRNALEASEKLFRQVLSNAPIGMAMTNDKGDFIGVNAAFCQLSGRSEKDLLQNGQLADLIPREHRKAMYIAVTDLMKEGESSVYTGEHRIICAGDRERWGLLNISWSFDKNEGTNLFITQVIDITEQKRLAQLKDEFVSTVSHELRTPLTSIKGALGLLTASKDLELSKGNARLIEIASSNAERLTDLVNDILDLERIASGEITFDIEDVDLGEVMENTEREILPFAVTHENTLRFEVQEEPLVILADARRTKQVLANLISNACKYSDTGSEVIVRAERIDNQAIVFVQNTGPGIPDAFRSRIFEAFSQADSSDTRAKGGTGLGLNITRQIVLRHGGKIGFESIPNGLTVFWFTIPLSNKAGKSQTYSPRLTLRPLDVPSLLHIEDDSDFAEVVSGALSGVADIQNASSLAAAKKAICAGHFDVVLLDWTLPDGDANTLLDEIIERQPHARIVALSADADRKYDSRLFASLVKSRAGIATLVSAVDFDGSIAS